MRDTAPTFSKVPLEDLAQIADEWLLDGELRGHSKRTLECRQDFIKKFLWLMQQRDYSAVGTPEVKVFLNYLNRGHEEPGGRWGNAGMTRPLRPVSIHHYQKRRKAPDFRHGDISRVV